MDGCEKKFYWAKWASLHRITIYVCVYSYKVTDIGTQFSWETTGYTSEVMETIYYVVGHMHLPKLTELCN